MLKRVIAYLLLCAVMACGFSGCIFREGKTEPLNTTGFAFDTTYTITLYEGGSKELLNHCIQKCREYERIFSRTLQESQLYQINEIESCYLEAVRSGVWAKAWKQDQVFYDAKDIAALTQKIDSSKKETNKAGYKIQKNGSIVFELSEPLAEIVAKGMEYAKVSEGRFDITIEPVTSLWNFSGDDKKIPEKKELQGALQYVDYGKISLAGNRLTFQMPGMGLDLGGIAKGYIADMLKAYLKDGGVTRAVINLGGNILCIGKKSAEENFLIGIQQPFADRHKTVAAVSVDDISVVSSGIYERYVTDETGKQYHHILNPKTGYPYENDLMAVTILSERSVDGDALSTTCFSMGKEQGMAYVDSLDGVYAMFITKDEKIWYSKGFQAYLTDRQNG